MSKKVRRVPVVLDAGEIKDLPQEDIRMILRGADELNMIIAYLYWYFLKKDGK